MFAPNFGKLDSLADFSDILPDSTDQDINEYFLDRGYTKDVSIRAASYDWRLGAGDANRFCIPQHHVEATCTVVL